VTGGLRGVMESAAAGFQQALAALELDRRGVVVGILPGSSTAEANPFVDVAIATGMGEARNCVIVNTAEVLIAVGGAFGTLSEIALALKQGKRVVAIEKAATPEEAVQRALGAMTKSE
jgi:uncharacterized protein (TIGR00725 family)